MFGRTYRVTAQAEPGARATPDEVNRLYVRSQAGDMIPLSALVTIKPITGPQYIERFQPVPRREINGAAAPGYSSGQATPAMEQVAAELPPGYTFEWTGTTFQEKRSGGQRRSSSRWRCSSCSWCSRRSTRAGRCRSR